jgi:phosphoribosylanthranilate isomerase
MTAELEKHSADRLTPKLWFSRMCEHLQKTTLRRPLVVGVFQGQSVEEINRIVLETGIDIVQLHGEESVADLERIQAPCIKVLHITPSASSAQEDTQKSVERLKAEIEQFGGKAIAILLDSKLPGTFNSNL